jgi:hypothetical protein
MGYIGYYMKKDKWLGYLILFPMILLTADSLLTYFSYFLYFRTRFILITLFCICAMILYPVFIFKNKKIRTVGAAVGALAVIAVIVVTFMRPPVYSTDIMSNGNKYTFDDTYSVYLADDKYGDVEIQYVENIEDYMVHADFRRAGDTVLTLESPTGEKTEYDLHIEMDTYEITKR